MRNGSAGILERMMANDWLTHLATNGAGTIHDREYPGSVPQPESVRRNGFSELLHLMKTQPIFTGRSWRGALDGLGYGCSLGKLISGGWSHSPHNG
ncbi:MAG: hypothetical protein R3C11_28100 [Planctomycetaceae bacterium]